MPPSESQLSVKVAPGARRNEIIGEHDGFIRIKLQAPPVEGKANIALLKFLATHLGIRSSQLRIISGETARKKRIGIRELAAEEVKRRLLDRT